MTLGAKNLSWRLGWLLKSFSMQRILQNFKNCRDKVENFAIAFKVLHAADLQQVSDSNAQSLFLTWMELMEMSNCAEIFTGV